MLSPVVVVAMLEISKLILTGDAPEKSQTDRFED